MRTRALLLVTLLFSLPAHSLIDAPPRHSVSPNINGLDIAYVVKKDQIKIALYVINHEAFDVICDVQYLSGPDKQDTAEKLLSPEKAERFRFTYGRRSADVILRLQCIKASERNPDDPK